MRKILLTIISVICLAFVFTACAHTGLVAGESVDSPNVNRSSYITASGTATPTIPDTAAQAEEYAASRKIPEALENSINNVLSKQALAITKAETALSEFSANVPDTSVPDLTLPTITVKDQIELETEEISTELPTTKSEENSDLMAK